MARFQRETKISWFLKIEKNYEKFCNFFFQNLFSRLKLTKKVVFFYVITLRFTCVVISWSFQNSWKVAWVACISLRLFCTVTTSGISDQSNRVVFQLCYCCFYGCSSCHICRLFLMPNITTQKKPLPNE